MRFGFNPEKALANADRLVQQGKVAQAIELYQKVLPHQPNNLNLRNNLGDLYAKTGRNADAIRTFLEVADQIEQQGLTPRVAAVLKKILRLDPAAPGVAQRLAQCLIAQGIHTEARVLLLGLVEKAEAAADWRQAVTALGQIASLDPDQPRLRVRLARARLRAGDAALAQTELLNAAKLMLDKKDWEGLDAALRELSELDTSSPAYKLLLARSRLAQGKSEEALAALPVPDEIKALGPDAAGVWRIACEAGGYEQAIALARAGLRGGHAIAAQVGQWFIEHGQLDEALNWIRSDAELFRRGDLEPIWLELLQAIHTSDANFVPGLETWAELVKEDRRSRRYVRLRLAPAYETAGLDEKAAACYRELLDEDPGNPDYARELSRLHAQLGVAAPPAQLAPATKPEPASSVAPEPPAEETAPEFEITLEPNPAVTEFAIASVAPSDAETGVESATEDDAAEVEVPAAIPEFLAAPPSAAPTEPPGAAARAVELDLSGDWLAASEEVPPVAAGEEPAEEKIGEIEFYLANDMLDEADRALAKQRHLFPEHARLLELSAQLGEKRAPAPPRAAAAAAAAAPGAGKAEGDILSRAFVAGPEPAAVRPVASSAPPAARAASTGRGLLDDVFQEFRSAVEETAAADNTDPEARYNLGVAYKEMGLSEEAIAELQKAFAGWRARGGPAQRLLSCGATIAMCFQESQMPELALQWYETTISQGGLSAREAIGPHFEAAKLLEELGRKDQALAHYRAVYAEDVDYQDVADCVRRLTQ